MTGSERVLLDTSVIIDLEGLDLGGTAGAHPAVSAVTIAELAFGLDVEDLLERQARTDRFYTVLREIPVLPFDVAAARLYGTLAATVRRSGRNPRPRRMDLQIAATAGAHAIPLVTRNPADFVGVEQLVQIVAA
ncbi:type II toxin-antitoxin system VapC family toxin [Actinomycetospora sp. TBRC 11914]|uniref:type II toxin-antitoxin system VapC family toxin n=1 Tax=Actinomycetospora sp. TBRC 11914 TaxID=2729387 RepID=UPI00145E4EC6|nr:type II toxin-antitoxin system VapC family toxin [Actinomycetospora sp. TBRC 11914]NMO92997.1 type II toxin-antitoxin system VapC family toxin [Actinomycetospora sp. TBRC 11914]